MQDKSGASFVRPSQKHRVIVNITYQHLGIKQLPLTRAVPACRLFGGYSRHGWRSGKQPEAQCPCYDASQLGDTQNSQGMRDWETGPSHTLAGYMHTCEGAA